MKRIITLLILLPIVIFLFKGSAGAIGDSTLVQEWMGHGIYGGGNWVDVIGIPLFEMHEVNVYYESATNLMRTDILGNFNDGGDYSISGVTAYLADLFLDVNLDGAYEVGAILKDHNEWTDGVYTPALLGNAGDIFSVSSVETAEDYFAGYWVDLGIPVAYGGMSSTGGGTPFESMVAVGSGTLMGSGTVEFVDLAPIDPLDPAYRWSLIFDASIIGWTGGDIGIYSGTTTCANDAIEGIMTPIPLDFSIVEPPASVPEPSVVWLLGSLLIGLSFLRRKKKEF